MDDVISAVNAKQPGDEVQLTLAARQHQAHGHRDAGRPPGDGQADRLAERHAAARSGTLVGHDGSSSAASPTSRTREEAARLGAWAIGLNHHPESPRFCPPEVGGGDRRRAEARARGRRRVRQLRRSTRWRRRRERAADDAPAPRRRGPRVLPGGGAAHRLQGDQGAPRAERRRHAAAEAYRTDFHLLDAHRPGTPGAPVRASTGSCSPAGARGAADPRRRADRPATSPRRSRPRARSPSTSPAASRASPGSRTTP